MLVARGVKDATTINRIVTVAKIVPIVLFVVVTAVLMNSEVFTANLWGDSHGSLPSQVGNTMMVTLFVFLGVEGASVYSRFARKRSDVGKATIGGFLGVLMLFALVSLVSYGTMTNEALGNLRQPSMAGVFNEVVGAWGGTFVSIGLIVSVLGAYLAWTLMAAEVLFTASRDDDMPRFLTKTNKADAPINALLMTSGTATLFLFVSRMSEDAFDFSLTMTGSTALIPYLLASAFALKVGWKDSRNPDGAAEVTAQDGAEPESYGGHAQIVIAALATFYSALLIFVAGLDVLLISTLLYAVGIVLFVITRKEQKRRVFSAGESIGVAALILAALTGIVLLATGVVSI